MCRAYRACRAPCAVAPCVCSACIAVALPILHLPSSCYLCITIVGAEWGFTITVSQLTSPPLPSTAATLRNAIKALPWYTLVREKVTDPTYAPWFMKFSDTVIANHSAAHVPVCDDNYSPPRCSNLYHDQSQTPGYACRFCHSAPPPQPLYFVLESARGHP